MTFEEYKEAWAARDFEKAETVLNEWFETELPSYDSSSPEELYRTLCLNVGPTIFIPWSMFAEKYHTR